MSTTTPKLGLTKPAGSEFIDEAVLNTNSDTIDAYAVSNDLSVRQMPFSWIYLTANLSVVNVSLSNAFAGTGVAYAGHGLTIAVNGANGRFTVPTDGWYRFGYHLLFTDANTTGNRGVILNDLDGLVPREYYQASQAMNEVSGSWPVLCTAGHRFELYPFQSTGSNRNISGSVAESTTRSYIYCELIRSAT